MHECTHWQLLQVCLLFGKNLGNVFHRCVWLDSHHGTHALSISLWLLYGMPCHKVASPTFFMMCQLQFLFSVSTNLSFVKASHSRSRWSFHQLFQGFNYHSYLMIYRFHRFATDFTDPIYSITHHHHCTHQTGMSLTV